MGIHSHGDGLIHIHPTQPEAGFEGATLDVFGDAIGLGLADGALTLPGGGTWRDGDLCNGVPGRVYVDRWATPDPTSSAERIFTDFDDVRFVADGEMYQIAFAPADSVPLVPPAFTALPAVSPALNQPQPEPWVRIGPDPDPASAFVWQVGELGELPCMQDAVELRPLDGLDACLSPAGEPMSAADAVLDARAVSFNRAPAVELTIAPALRERIEEFFMSTPTGQGQAFTLALEVDGLVVTAPVLARLPASPDRLIVAGGLSRDAAERLAAAFGG